MELIPTNTEELLKWLSDQVKTTENRLNSAYQMKGETKKGFELRKAYMNGELQTYQRLFDGLSKSICIEKQD